MARIPLQIAQSRLETGPMVDYSGVSRSPVGQALQGFGSELGGLSDQMHAVAERRRQQEEDIENFQTMQSADQLELAVQGDLTDIQQKVPPSGLGYHDAALAAREKREAEFMASVPERLQPKLGSILETKRMEFSQKQAQAELELRQGWYRDGVTQKQESLQTQVFNDPATFDNAREEGLLAIEASGLPEIEKVALRESWDETLALTLGEREVRDAESDPDNSIAAASRLGVAGANTTDNGGDAMSLLREFEGFRETPYWDKTALRTGYGSDTTTRADGSVERVTKGTRVSRADGERDLARRAKEFESTARGQVGQREWGALPPQAQAALVSVTYNYGSLPSRVVNAVKSGDIGQIAQAVESLGSDNEGINRKRRSREAAIIRGGGAIANNAPAMDERYSALPLDKRLEIFDRTQAAAGRARTAFAAQEKAAYDEHKGSLELGIQTGDIASERTILNDAMLSDAHKADLLSSLKTKMGDQIATQQAVAAFNGGALTVDPYSTEGKKTVDNVWKALSESAGPEQAQASLDSLVQQTGAVPQGVINLLRQGLTSQNPTDIANAAQTAARISALDGAALGRRDGGAEVQKAADDFGFYVNTLNLPPEEAARRMADANKPERQFQRKALEPAAKEFRKELEGEDLASVFSGGFFSSDPELGFGPGQALGIQAEFMAIAEDQFYAANGDPEIAKNRAIEEMKRLYGVASVTGRSVVMKHPPDKYWPKMRLEQVRDTPYARVTGSESLGYATMQLREDLSQIYPDVDMERVQLVTTPETDAMVKRGEMPAYAVLYQGTDGVMQTIPGRLWRPDFDAAQERQAPVLEREERERISNARDMEQTNRELIQREEILEQRQTDTGARLRGDQPISQGKPQPLPELPETPMSERQIGSTRTPEQIRSMSQEMLDNFKANR